MFADTSHALSRRKLGVTFVNGIPGHETSLPDVYRVFTNMILFSPGSFKRVLLPNVCSFGQL